MSFFNSVIDFFNLISELVTNVVSSLILFFKLIYTSIALPSYLTTLLPSVIGSCVIFVVAIAVVKIVVGR